MPGAMVQLLVLSFCMGMRYDVDFSLNWVICCVILSVLLSAVVSPVPGGGIACCMLLFTQLGISEDALVITAIVELSLNNLVVAANEICLKCITATTA